MVVKTTGTYNVPTARIAVNKNIVKHYHKSDRSNAENSITLQSQNVYLTGSTEFQIELFNPTQNPVLAKIKLNGNYISDSGVVIYPGQRIFLDRYLDNVKKFKFDTYEVSGNNAEVEKAIEKNGLVEVEFYRELNKPIYSAISYNNPFYRDCSVQPYFYDTTITCNFVQSDLIKSNLTDSMCTAISGSIYDNLNSTKKSSPITRSKNTTKETGRIEKGNDSNQILHNVDMDFELWTFHTVMIHILPNSEKQLTSKDIYKARKYCSECGGKVKPKDKFCSICGNKL